MGNLGPIPRRLGQGHAGRRSRKTGAHLFVDFRCGGGQIPPGFSDDLEERLAYFSKLAVANPEVRKSLGVCYDAVTRKTEERVGTGILF